MGTDGVQLILFYIFLYLATTVSQQEINQLLFGNPIFFKLEFKHFLVVKYEYLYDFLFSDMLQTRGGAEENNQLMNY